MKNAGRFQKGQTPHNRLPDERIAEIVDLYSAGTSSASIADRLGVSVTTIHNHLRKHGVLVQNPKLLNRLSKDQQNRVAEEYAMGKTMAEVAEIVGTSYTSVYNCLKRRGIKTRASHEYFEHHALNEHFFDTIDTEEKAYFLGFLYADGCLLRDRSHTIRINLHQKDRAILERFKSLLQSTAPLYEFKTLKQFCLQVASKHMWTRLSVLGCVPVKTLVIQYPEWMPEELEHHFIRGYFDGDGTLGIYRHVRGRRGGDESPKVGASLLGTASLCLGVKRALERETGVVASLYETGEGGGTIYKLGVGGPRLVQKMMRYLYRDATIYLERKHSIFLEIEEYCKGVDDAKAARPRICSECKQPVLARGLCRKHYVAWKAASKERPRCSVCSSPVYARGLCMKHYGEWRAHGEVRPQCRKCHRAAIAHGLCQTHRRKERKEHGKGT